MDEICAKVFIVEDENGKTRIRFDVDKEGPSIGMSDENGIPRDLLYVIKSGGPILKFFDENNKAIWSTP